MKVARERREIPELYESAVREATSAFGRGECFVERYLDKPRHVEAQVLADTHGNVIVVGTRDCSLQRRFQKLVEEAPAPFLSDEQRAHDPRVGEGDLPGGRLPRRRHRRVPRRAGRADLVPGGQHPAAGRAPGLRGDLGSRPRARAVPHRRGRGAAPHRTTRSRAGTPSSSGSTARTPAAASCPRPAPSPRSRSPSGPGVRVDAGVEAGSVIGGQFDSLLAKLIVTGSDRAAGAGAGPPRAGRVPGRGHGDGAAVPPARRARPGVRVARDFTVHTRWIETEWDNTVAPFAGGRRGRGGGAAAVGGRRGRRPAARGVAAGRPRPGRRRAARPRRTTTRKRHGKGAPKTSGDAVTAPMQGTVIKVAVSDGDTVAAGDLVVVLEAMKMENPVTAHKNGTITEPRRRAGQLGRPGRGALRDQGLSWARRGRRPMC